MSSAPRSCSACGAQKREGKKLLLCGRCRAVRYCSEVCQRKDWERGHRTACAPGGQAAKKEAPSSGMPSPCSLAHLFFPFSEGIQHGNGNAPLSFFLFFNSSFFFLLLSSSSFFRRHRVLMRQEMLEGHAYFALDYDEELRKWQDPSFRAANAHFFQLEFNEPIAPTEEEVQAREARRQVDCPSVKK